MEPSDIVLSLCGHDAGSVLFVMEVDGAFLLLADGKRRRAEAPKRKKAKHTRFLTQSDSRAARKIRNGEKVTNNELRRTLSDYIKSTQPSGILSAPPSHIGERQGEDNYGKR